MTEFCHRDVLAEGSQEKIQQQVRDDKSHFPRPQGRGILLHRPDCKILKRVQDDRVLSEAHGKYKPHYTHFTHSTNAKRVAFTLAEVLITLGIIGVVAAMTIPTLISNYKKSVVETKLKKFYSLSNQAIRLSEIDNGPKENWKARCSNLEDCKIWYNTYLNNYLKTVKVEHKELSGRASTLAYLTDGSLMILKAGYDIIFYPQAADYDEKTSISENEEGEYLFPDRGTKSFLFAFLANQPQSPSFQYYKNKGIEPYKSLKCKEELDEAGEKVIVCNDITHEQLLNNPDYGCGSSRLNAYCTALIQENNWKIPDYYPLKF